MPGVHTSAKASSARASMPSASTPTCEIRVGLPRSLVSWATASTAAARASSSGMVRAPSTPKASAMSRYFSPVCSALKAMTGMSWGSTHTNLRCLEVSVMT